MRVRPSLLLPALSLVVVTGGVVGALPAQAADVVDVQLTQDGPQPRQLTVDAGDSVRFVNTDTFVHRVVSDSSGWAFDTRALVPGDSYTVKPALTKPGTYSYRGAGLDSFRGAVVVPGAAPASPRASATAVRTPAPAATPAPSASGTPSGSAEPTTSGTPAAPPSTGGTGSVQGPPPLAGGSFQDLSPAPLAGGPAPLVAPGETPAADPFAVPLPTPVPADVAPPSEGAAPTTALGAPPVLSSPVEARRYGLPLALAVVLLGGVVSLLVRLLLAEAPAGTRTA